MKQKIYGYRAGRDSLPIPASVPKKYQKHIADVDNAGVEDGKLFYSCRGIAFRDAGTEVASHCYCGTVAGFRDELRYSEQCFCDTCKKEFWDAR